MDEQLDQWIRDNTDALEAQLADHRAAVSRIEQLLTAMGSVPATSPTQSTNGRRVTAPTPQRRRKLSKQARANISRRMKAYWRAKR